MIGQGERKTSDFDNQRHLLSVQVFQPPTAQFHQLSFEWMQNEAKQQGPKKGAKKLLQDQVDANQSAD